MVIKKEELCYLQGVSTDMQVRVRTATLINLSLFFSLSLQIGGEHLQIAKRQTPALFTPNNTGFSNVLQVVLYFCTVLYCRTLWRTQIKAQFALFFDLCPPTKITEHFVKKKKKCSCNCCPVMCTTAQQQFKTKRPQKIITTKTGKLI